MESNICETMRNTDSQISDWIVDRRVLETQRVGNGGVVYFSQPHSTALRHGGLVAVISTLFSFHPYALGVLVATTYTMCLKPWRPLSTGICRLVFIDFSLSDCLSFHHRYWIL